MDAARRKHPKDLVRRSNWMVPATEAGLTHVEALVHGSGEAQLVPDAVTLDLEDSVLSSGKAAARTLMREAVPAAARSEAEVFVRVSVAYLYADLDACVWAGLAGVMLPKVENAGDVTQASDMIGEFERRRGLEVGSLELIIMVESALGVWNLREVVHSCDRVTQVALGESGLCLDLGVVPTEEYDPLEYARGRLVIEATAARVQPLGITHPLGSLPRAMPREELLRLATIAKDLGSKGVICPDPSWIEPANVACSPTTEQVEFYTQVREVFAEAVAAGTAAVPFRERMLDVPVDEWAKDVLHRAAACEARDEQKKRRLELDPTSR